VVVRMTVFEAIVLIFAFATLLMKLLDYIDKLK